VQGAANRAAVEVCGLAASPDGGTLVHRTAALFNVAVRRASADAAPPAYITCVAMLPCAADSGGMDRSTLVSQLRADLAIRGGLAEAQLEHVQTRIKLHSHDMLCVTFRMSSLADSPVHVPSQSAAHICSTFAVATARRRKGSVQSGGKSSAPDRSASLWSMGAEREKVEAPGSSDIGVVPVLSVSYCTRRQPSVLPGSVVRARVACYSNLYEFAQERAYLNKHVVPALRDQVGRLGMDFSWRELTWHADESERASHQRMQVPSCARIPSCCPWHALALLPALLRL
jgi:hypothetical protein